ncbi:MAG: NADH-quinone oxidoreductase subunit NuoF [Burkholderiales bacterium]
MSEPRVFFGYEHERDRHTLAAYQHSGGYSALDKALTMMTPAEVQQTVLASGLQGRGGAGFSTGIKWDFIDERAPVKYLCCNIDEGEPGTFKDRWILEHSPHQLVEGMLIAAYAIGARHAFAYIRGEFDLPLRRLQEALAEARAAGFVGEFILGTEFSCDIVVHRGAGAYVCGEESSLINSLEGKKGFPRNKPPFPALKGLYQKPTVVNNVETLATVPWIIDNGGEAYATIGVKKSPGTRLFGVSGHVARPGIFERPTGYPLRDLIMNDAGGMLGGKALKAVIPGGSSTPILTAEEALAATLDPESMAKAGTMLGSGAVIVIAEGTCMVRLLQVLSRFYAHESCGQCTPCREGTDWMNQILGRIVAGEGTPADLATLRAIPTGIRGNTICALGDAAAMPVASFLAKFGHEFEHYVRTGRSLCDGRLEAAA